MVKDLAQVGALFPKLPLESIGGCLRSALWLREPGEEYREAQHHQSTDGSVSLPQRAELIRTEFLGVNSSLSENNLDSYYIEKELPYRKALAALNRQGIPFNAGCFNEFCDDLHQQSDALNQELRRLAGARFNPRRNSDVAHFLFNRCRIKSQLSDQTGPRCDTDALRALPTHNEFVNLVLDERLIYEFSQKSRIQSIFPDSDDNDCFSVEPACQRSHHASGATLYRNDFINHLPGSEHHCRHLRRAVISRSKTSQLARIHFTNARLTTIAQLSGDPNLREALAHDDPWRQLAVNWLGRDISHIGPQQKRLCADGLNCLIAGRQAASLCLNHSISRDDATNLINHIERHCPSLKQWIHTTLEHSSREGWIETLDQRRVWLPAGSPFMQRQVMDICIEGSLNDFSLNLFLNGSRWPQSTGLFFNQNEWLFDIPSALHDEWQTHISQHLATHQALGKFLMGSGQNWFDATTNIHFTWTNSPQQRMTA